MIRILFSENLLIFSLWKFEKYTVATNTFPSCDDFSKFTLSRCSWKQRNVSETSFYYHNGDLRNKYHYALAFLHVGYMLIIQRNTLVSSTHSPETSQLPNLHWPNFSELLRMSLRLHAEHPHVEQPIVLATTSQHTTTQCRLLETLDLSK